jgi:ribose transport system substrate-binding protein
MRAHVHAQVVGRNPGRLYLTAGASDSDLVDLESAGSGAEEKVTAAPERSAARGRADAARTAFGKDQPVRSAFLGRVAAGLGVGVLLTACGSGSGAARELDPRSSATVDSSDPVVRAAKTLVEASLTASSGFTPPASGPKAQAPGATIAYVAADLTNGGINAVATGVQQAATRIGWKVAIVDGKASAQGRTDALTRAIAMKPAGIILGGFDAAEQSTTITKATAAGIPVVGWHAGAKPGPDPADGLFTNVTTDPLEVARIAADFAIADSDGTAGVAIFTDSQYEIAVKKADAIRAEIQKCSGCSVLEYEDSPIAEADSRMPALISSLLRRDGTRLTYLLAINGNYFNGARTALREAGKPAGGPPKSVAAGDGDAAEFRRIRAVDYQAATVAEPLYLQGWQLVDELNRALAGQPASAFIAKPGLVARANVPAGDVFDPASGYRDIYARVWSGA